MLKLAPIALFTYNRLEETKRTVESLRNNCLAKESELFIFSDGPKNRSSKHKVIAVRNYLRTIRGFKDIRIIESSFNKGLASSIILGVSELLEKYGKIIVLEDDLETSSNFLSFLNQGLNFFELQNDIYSINGYSPFIENISSSDDSIYFHSRAFPWGWATWSDRWDLTYFNNDEIISKLDSSSDIIKKFQICNGNDVKKMLLDSLNGKNNSWYIKWIFSNFCMNKRSVFPILSKVENIGFNNSGVHCKEISSYKSKMDFSNNLVFDFKNPIQLKPNDSRFLKYFTKKYKLKFRFFLLFKKDGYKIVFNEVKTRFLQNFDL